jgi:hypothetical protein
MFRGGKKVRVSDSVLRKVRRAAEFLGCTAEEFIERALERESEMALSLSTRREASPEDEGRQSGVA